MRLQSSSKIARSFGLLILVTSVAVLWAFPTALFRQPTAPGEIGVASWEFPIFALISFAAVTSLLFRSRWPAIPIGFGAYLLGVATDLIVGFLSFGNGTDDRYMPLVVLPFLISLAGLISLLGGITGKRRLWRHLWLGTVLGVSAAAVVGNWVLMRGGRDWLRAPYGFDITLLVVVLAVAVIAVGSRIRPQASAN
jgi:hypothetical protein